MKVFDIKKELMFFMGGKSEEAQMSCVICVQGA